MTKNAIIVDADGHVLEPEDTWTRYLEPKYRGRAIRIARDEKGIEQLIIDDKCHKAIAGMLGAIGGIGMQDDVEALTTPGMRSYRDGLVEGGYDPAARVKVLDDERIDKVLLYPTLGIFWEGHVTDVELADAYTRAYNRYIVDFCSHDRSRLIPIAHINLGDPDRAVKEVKRARKDGCVGVYLSPETHSRGNRSIEDPVFREFFEVVSDLEMPIGFHVTVREPHQMMLWPYSQSARVQTNLLMGFSFLAIEVMAVFTQIISSGMLDTYPRLKLAVLETGSNWLASWLDRLDHKYEAIIQGVPNRLKMRPSEYFRRQCLISADPDETMTGDLVRKFGDDKVIWASDYPHIDGTMNVLNVLREQLKDLPEPSQNKILGENAVKFYALA